MARGDSIPSRGLGERQQQQIQKDFDRIREKVEKLTGERGDAALTLSAVRRGELAVLAGMTLKSSNITAAPTAADYNKLRSDIETVFNLLVRISNARGTADIPKV